MRSLWSSKKTQKSYNLQIRRNSFAFSFVFFIYSIASFPGQYIGSGSAIIFLSLLVIVPIFISNYSMYSNKGTQKVLIFEFFVLFLLLLESIIYPEFEGEIFNTILSVATIGTVGMVTATLQFDLDLCYKYGTAFAILGAISSILILVFPQNDLFFLSMRFGYALLPTVLWFLMLSIQKRSKVSFFFFFVTFFFLFVWGSRGTIVVIFIFLLLYCFLYKKKYAWLLAPFLVLFTVIDIQSLLWDVIVWLQDLTGSRKLASYGKIIFSEEEARDSIYSYCVDKMKNNYWGCGVGWWKYDSNMYGLYPHNIVLHIGTEFGVFGLLFLLFFLIKSVRVLMTSEKESTIFFLFFFSIGVGRLLVSSVYWERPEFWFLIGLFIFTTFKKRKK